jgi:6-phosphogluconolactonase (cycloisomerase 2 family)
VYPLKANGDAAPLRVISGPKTQLNWSAAMFLDQERQELYVASDGGDAILVFSESADGDVAPLRVLKGAKTGLSGPTGVFVDMAHNELWVANLGNHTATVYPRTAEGNVAPSRIIRSAPLGKEATFVGNSGAVAYDSKREEILLPT